MIIRASDIRQHIYCPRQTYFAFVVPTPKPLTYKMNYGKREHDITEKLEGRRNLKRYNLKDGKKIFSPDLFSPALSLSGKADMVILKDNHAYPIDYKFTSGMYVNLGYKLQLLTYSRIIEVEWGIESKRGYLFFIKQNSVRTVEFTLELNELFDKVLEEMRKIIEEEMFPPPPKSIKKCIDCRFRRWCGDV